MEIVYDDATLESYMARATEASPEHPVLVDRFLDEAIEIDVDALFDGEELYLGGVMEHIEEVASTPATRRARCRPSRWGTTTSAASGNRRRRSRAASACSGS